MTDEWNKRCPLDNKRSPDWSMAGEYRRIARLLSLFALYNEASAATHTRTVGRPKPTNWAQTAATALQDASRQAFCPRICL